MASTPASLASLLLGVALLAGCSTGPPPETGVADATATPPASSPSATGTDEPSPTDAPSPTDDSSPTEPRGTGTPSVDDEPATVAPPDLSSNEIDCDAVDEPCDYGEDPELDRLWDACADGDGTACDRLYYDSGFDTRYEQFGNTCGDRGLTTPCPEELDA